MIMTLKMSVILSLLFAVSGTCLASPVDRHQILNEYRNFVRYAEDLPADMVSNANRRIAELQAELGEREQSQNSSFGQAMAVFRKNIQTYTTLLKKFPDKPDNDRVLYGLARAYDGVSDLQLATSTLERLIREYPDSELVEEATFRRAEMLFEQFDFVGADKAYRDVIAFGPESRFYAYALYKHGWSLFKQERYEGGLDSLLKALDYLIRDVETHNDVLLLSQLPADQQALFDDTLRAISLSFSYMSDAMSITNRLALHSERRNEYLIYGNLADLYMKKQRYYDASQVYQSFAKNHPDHILAPKYLILSIKAAEAGKFPSIVLEKKIGFAKRFDLDADFWKQHKRSDFPKVVSYLKKTMQELARHYHALAQISKKDKDFQEAISWYRRYINSFDGDPETAEISYTLAEALYQNKQYDQAASQFEKIAYEYEAYARSAEAGYAALLALQKSQGAVDEGQPPSQAWLKKALHFSTTYPDHPESTNVLLKVAEGLYADKDWDRLIEAETALLQRKEIKPKQILTATLMLGHAYFQKKQFAKAIEYYEKAINLKPSGKKRSEIQEWLASAYYKQGEITRQKGELKKAAHLFGRAYKTAPKSEIAPVALYDSAKAAFDMQDWPEAITRLRRFSKHFPDHRLASNIPAMLAKSFESFGQTDKAIKAYLRLSKQGGEPDVRQNALWKAAELLREKN
ncbi:MAG: tetratricopeptide repeat protein, partial [Gammaproteobacteria bacterium]